MGILTRIIVASVNTWKYIEIVICPKIFDLLWRFENGCIHFYDSNFFQSRKSKLIPMTIHGLITNNINKLNVVHKSNANHAVSVCTQIIIINKDNFS